MSEKPSFFAELKRRNVYKVAVAYVVVAWLLLQAASIFLPAFDAPFLQGDFGSPKTDKRLDPLRGDPRFENLERRFMTGQPE